ncbi:MAG: sugar phosphate isomerase/epimerase [Chloroflexi bacterium]|nr:sugar phosphate isomerase/epimerase [Chloroflexota bacterium]
MITGRPAPLAYSTLACPEWDALEAVAKGAAYGFDAIEWRGGPDGTIRVAWADGRRRDLRQAIRQAGMSSIAVTAYPNLLSGDPAEHARSIATIVEHVQLASDLDAPAVRVFLGIADDGAPESELRRRAIASLEEALRRTRDVGVALAIEPHDDHVRAEHVRPVLDAIADPRLGVVWDIANAWSAGEQPGVGLKAYDGRIVWVQVKDGIGRGRNWRLCELGAGEVPLEAALTDLAASITARGAPMPPISLEWERAWHPDLAPADVALPAAHRWLAERLARLGSPA